MVRNGYYGSVFDPEPSPTSLRCVARAKAGAAESTYYAVGQLTH